MIPVDVVILPEPAGDLPVVDVVILSWNDGPLLRQAVESARGSRGVDARIIVVDNGSDEDPGIDDPEVRLVRNLRNRGVAAGRNQGIAVGVSEVVLLLDSDAVLEPCSLRRMVDVLVSDPRIACVGPVFLGQTPEASGGAAPTLGTKLSRLVGLRSSYEASVGSAVDGIGEVDVVIGACQCFRRSAYESIGGIDEAYFYGPEDVDFCMRLRQAGWRVVQVAGAPVSHPPRRRHRRVFSRNGRAHAWAVVRFLWRHRSYRSEVAPW